jgi:hypothetical protein
MVSISIQNPDSKDSPCYIFKGDGKEVASTDGEEVEVKE